MIELQFDDDETGELEIIMYAETCDIDEALALFKSEYPECEGVKGYDVCSPDFRFSF